MIRIARYFENAFDDREISDDEIRAFAVDHLGRLTAASTNDQYDDLIAATDTALTAFAGSVADESVAAAIRKARTAATNALIDEIKALWSRREGRIRDLFGVGSVEYIEFYPQGVTQYREADLENLPKYLTRYRKIAEKYATAVGAPFVAEWTALEARWTAIRGAQVTQKGTASTAADVADTARTVLERQLQVNVLTLAARFVGQPEKATLFFQQSLLENPARPPAPAATPGAPPKP